MSDRNLEPASTVLAKIGGVEVAASITGKHVSRIYRWTYPREKGGTGGVIPHEDATKLLKHASENNIPLSASDFFMVDEGPPAQLAATA
jgi:hypothetical protein